MHLVSMPCSGLNKLDFPRFLEQKYITLSSRPLCVSGFLFWPVGHKCIGYIFIVDAMHLLVLEANEFSPAVS